MGFLKGFGLTLIAVLMFLSVVLLGVGVTVNLTALNPKFVDRQIEKLDIAALINQTASDDPSAADMPAAVRSFLNNELPKHSEEIKAATEQATNRLYDYILGRTDRLDLNTVFGQTVLDPQLIYTLADSMDWPSLANELVIKAINDHGGVDPTFSYLLNYVDDAMVTLDPWFKSTLRQVVPPIRDYVLGQTPTLNISIPLEEPAAVLYSTLQDAFNRNPPPQLAGLSAAQKQLAFNSFFFLQIVPSIPSIVNVDSNFFSGAPQDLYRSLSDVKTGVDNAKIYTTDYWLAFYGLILFIILLMGLAFLILRRLSAWLMFIGIILLVFGLSGITSTLIANTISNGIDFGSMPAALQSWLPGVIQDAVKPFLYFSVGAGVLGIVGIIASGLTRRRATQPQNPMPAK